MSTETKRLQDAINFITSAGREAIEEIELLHQQLHGTRQREGDEPLPFQIDGRDIRYWHQIATSTLKTNDELIDHVREAEKYLEKQRTTLDELRYSLREKERINADLEQQLKSAEIAAKHVIQTYVAASGYEGEDSSIAFRKHLERIAHQSECAKTAQDERDTALRELDAMRERLQKADETAGRYCNEALELRKKLQFAERQMDIAHTALLQR